MESISRTNENETETERSKKITNHAQHLTMVSALSSVNATTGQDDSKTSSKVKSSEGSGVETVQEEQLDALLNQSA